jgi:hypothetical protein
MDLVEQAVRPPVKFPEMRDQVIDSLRSLADSHYQWTTWGRYEEGVNYYDDLTLNVHVLYDDCLVVPDPSNAVGAILYEDEVQAFGALHLALGPMLDDLQDASDAVYRADPRWPQVVNAAAAALVVMGVSE